MSERSIEDTLHKARLEGIGNPLDYIDELDRTDLDMRLKLVDRAGEKCRAMMLEAQGADYQLRLATEYAKRQSTGDGVTQPAGYLNARSSWNEATTKLIYLKICLQRSIEYADEEIEQLGLVLQETEEWENYAQ